MYSAAPRSTSVNLALGYLNKAVQATRKRQRQEAAAEERAAKAAAKKKARASAKAAVVKPQESAAGFQKTRDFSAVFDMAVDSLPAMKTVTDDQVSQDDFAAPWIVESPSKLIETLAAPENTMLKNTLALFQRTYKTQPATVSSGRAKPTLSPCCIQFRHFGLCMVRDLCAKERSAF